MKSPISKWLGLAAAVGLIILFFASLITGHKVENEQAAPNKQPELSNNEVRKYSVNEHSKQENREMMYQTTSDETQSNIQKNIVKFLNAYVPFDSEQPQAFLERTKPYVTAEFHKNLQSEFRRGTLSTTKTTVANIELYPDKEGKSVQWWSADINVQNTDNKGKKSDGLLVYIVKVKLIDGEWKADDIGVRSRAWNQ